jgi:hypothetical protein
MICLEVIVIVMVISIVVVIVIVVNCLIAFGQPLAPTDWITMDIRWHVATKN